MTCDLVALCIDAHDPPALADFWSGVLGWEMAGGADGIALLPSDDVHSGSAPCFTRSFTIGKCA